MGFIYRIFLKGLLTLLPFILTIYLFAWIVTRAELAFGEPLRSSPFYFPGAGVVLGVALVFSVGLLVNNLFTQPFIDWLEGQLQRMPIFKSIYNPLKDVTNLFASASSGGTGAQKVVMVHLPGLGVEVIGLVTRDRFADLPTGTIGDGHLAVFIPFSYGVGGFTVIVPRSAVRETKMAADKALQLAITGWIKTSK